MNANKVEKKERGSGEVSLSIDLMLDREVRIPHRLLRAVSFYGRVKDAWFSRELHFAHDTVEPLLGFLVLLEGHMHIPVDQVFLIILQEFRSK